MPIVEFLIKQGATIDLKTKREATPLATAAEKGHFSIVKLLVDHGAVCLYE